MESTIIPDNREGKENDITFDRILDTRGAASDCFKRAYKRLRNPDIWQDLTGAAGAAVSLFTEAGGEARRLVQTGDFLRFDIPGPGPGAGSGYDWVQVKAVEDKTAEGAEEELFAMRVHPSPGPAWQGKDVAHFFDAGASSTFVVQRQGNRVIASYHGRNEQPNNETSSITDNIRNTVVAAGAAIGLSEAQWSALMRALLQDEIGG